MTSAFDYSRLSVLLYGPIGVENSQFSKCLEWSGLSGVECCHTFERAQALIKERVFDIVIVDDQLSDSQVRQFVATARKSEANRAATTRFILTTQRPSGARVLQSIKLGFSSVLAVPAATTDILRHIAYALTRYEPATVMPSVDHRPNLDSVLDSAFGDKADDKGSFMDFGIALN